MSAADLDLREQLTTAPVNEAPVAGPAPRLRFTPGASFILDTPERPDALWGEADEVLWAQGESLLITGTPGVGKTTLAQQVVLALLGLRADVLGYTVAKRSRVLYLAMDRPRQIARSFRRMVTEADRRTLAGLTVWEGPPAADVARDPGVLLWLARECDAQVIVLDSLKDAALGLTSDEVGAAVNRAVQTCLANGVDVLLLHHQVKRSGSGNGGKPIDLADVYGSGWITAGAGSVILLHGDAGAPTVELRHLKPVMAPVGPLHVQHDHTTGTTTLADDLDPLEWLRRQRQPVNVHHLAEAYGDLERPTVERARRTLQRLTRQGLANEHPGTKGGAGGGTPTTWTLASRPGQGDLLDDLEDPA